MKYVVKIIESLFVNLLYYCQVVLMGPYPILIWSALGKDRHNGEDLGPYPNWKEFIHSKFHPNLSQPLSMHHLMKCSHHFETYMYEFQHPTM
jgi:hypothetical protein